MPALRALLRRGAVFALAAAAACALTGCDSGKLDARGVPIAESAGGPVAADSGRARAAQSARPARSPSPPAAVPTVVGGRIQLASGVSLAVPEGATPTTAPGGIPQDVARGHHAFKLPGGNRRLMVSELSLAGQSCAARLADEWARMQGAKGETDPKKLELRKTKQVEERKVGDRRVLYAESMQGTSLADAGAPFAATASALMCAGEELLLVMYIATESEVAPEVRTLIDTMLASVRDGGAPAGADGQGSSR